MIGKIAGDIIFLSIALGILAFVIIGIIFAIKKLFFDN